jgi:hypothetical protein
MTAAPASPVVSQQAAVDAALLVLKSMGLSLDDLTAAPQPNCGLSVSQDTFQPEPRFFRETRPSGNGPQESPGIRSDPDTAARCARQCGTSAAGSC